MWRVSDAAVVLLGMDKETEDDQPEATLTQRTSRWGCCKLLQRHTGTQRFGAKREVGQDVLDFKRATKYLRAFAEVRQGEVTVHVAGV